MKFKKIIATILTFCILLSSVAVSAFATNGVTVQELEDGSRIITAKTEEEAMKYLQEFECEECETAPETGKWTRKTTCNGQCGHAPAIIVPGILQSQVYLLDNYGKIIMSGEENKSPEEIKKIINNKEEWDKVRANGERPTAVAESLLVQNFFNFDELLAKLPEIIGELTKAIVSKDTDAFADYVSGLVGDNLSAHYFNEDGTRNNDIYLVEYWHSLAEATEKDISVYFEQSSKNQNLTESQAIYKQVDTEEYAELAGADHLYFYAYPSFGDTYESAERLNEFVQMVKAETGHSKVNLVFISLGGTIGTAYFDLYPNTNDVNKAIFASSALDGSSLLGDLFAGNYTVDDSELMLTEVVPDLFNSFAQGKVPMWLAHMINILLRAIPPVFGDDVEQVLMQVIQTIVDDFLVKCPSMWALIPSEMYPELSEKYLSDPKLAGLKEKTDRYYNAQITNKVRLPQLNARDDMAIFIVCGYGLHLPGVLESFYTKHSDSIIESSSQSGGAYFAPIGETLPDDYVPAIDDSYISPDKMVDAGAGYLPDNTWFVYGQGHMNLQDALHDYISMCVHIAYDDSIKDARVNNGGYPQFNEYRYTKTLAGSHATSLGGLLGKAFVDDECTIINTEYLNKFNPTDAQRKEFEAAAREAADAFLSKNWDAEATKKAEIRLLDIMKELGMDDEGKWFFDSKQTSLEKTLNDILNFLFETISKIISKFFGYKSFWS